MVFPLHKVWDKVVEIWKQMWKKRMQKYSGGYLIAKLVFWRPWSEKIGPDSAIPTSLLCTNILRLQIFWGRKYSFAANILTLQIFWCHIYSEAANILRPQIFWCCKYTTDIYQPKRVKYATNKSYSSNSWKIKACACRIMLLHKFPENHW